MGTPRGRRNDREDDKKLLRVLFYLDFSGKFHLKFAIKYLIYYKETKMAELNISERQAGDITILDMDGKVTIGEGSVALRNTIRRLVGEGKKKILLNLAGVGYV